MDKKPLTAQEQVAAAAVTDDKGRLRGYRAVGPSGQLVLLAPQTIGLKNTLDKGIHVTGLKPGWRLATIKDEERKAKEAAERDAERAKGG